jgi:hypothetical protein
LDILIIKEIYYEKLITTIILLVMTLPILAQERVVEHIDGNLYSYKMYDGKQLTQRGYYKNINGTLFEHGIWKDNFGTTALFKKVRWFGLNQKVIGSTHQMKLNLID